MDRFYATKRILANGNLWTNLLTSKYMTDKKNYFEYQSIRKKWREMEKHFCAETVMLFLDEMSRLMGEKDRQVVELEEINRVVVRFERHDAPGEYQFVEYVFCGDMLLPERLL